MKESEARAKGTSHAIFCGWPIFLLWLLDTDFHWNRHIALWLVFRLNNNVNKLSRVLCTKVLSRWDEPRRMFWFAVLLKKSVVSFHLSRLRLLPGFLAPEEADWMFSKLLAELPWSQKTNYRQGGYRGLENKQHALGWGGWGWGGVNRVPRFSFSFNHSAALNFLFSLCLRCIWCCISLKNTLYLLFKKKLLWDFFKVWCTARFFVLLFKLAQCTHSWIYSNLPTNIYRYILYLFRLFIYLIFY